MPTCTVCKSSNLRSISLLDNVGSWAGRFVNPFKLPGLVWDTAKGLGNGFRYMAGDKEMVLGRAMKCTNCGNFLALCGSCNATTRTEYPANSTSKTCGNCGKTMAIGEI